jgi:Tfp pilus assembly protein PilO
MLNIKNIDRICIAIIVVVAVGLGFFAFKKTLTEKKRIRQENRLLSSRIQDLNSAETNLKQIKNILSATQTRFKQIDARIPQSAEIGTFISQLDRLVKRRQIVMVSLLPQAEIKAKLYTQVPIRMIFKGQFKNVHLFINDLETMTRLLSMDRLVVRGSAKETVRYVDLVASVFER